MQQKRVMPDRSEKIWNIDIAALRKKLPAHKWLENDRLLMRDVKEMSEYLPHWILTLGLHGALTRSKCCNDNVAPIDGEIRCILCHRPCNEAASSPLWMGLLPVNLEGRDKALKKIETAQNERKLNYPIIAPQGKKHLMVPVIAEYPVTWPNSPPAGYYADKKYIETLKLPTNYQTHVVGERGMCLYHSGQWNNSNGIMHVVANRIATHAFALLRLGNGENNIGFFNTDYNYYDR